MKCPHLVIIPCLGTSHDRIEMNINWRDSNERKEYERGIEDYPDRRLEWSVREKIKWTVEIFLIQLLIITALYGGCAYNLVNNEIDLKAAEEEKMITAWISQGGKVE